MVKIFNNAMTTFMLCADDGAKKMVPPKGFAEIDDKFTGDITYRRAIEKGVFTPFTTAKQGDAAERKANETPEVENGKKKPEGKEKPDGKADESVGEANAK